MKVKINWKDPRFIGLTKKQIKEFCEKEAKGKNPVVPKPQLTKRMNKKIKKMQFIQEVKAQGNDAKNKKKDQLLQMSQIGIVKNENSKKEVVLKKSMNAPKVLFDASFEELHNKKVN